MRLISRIIFALSVLVGAAQAQTWFKVANEGDTVKATATVRYGVNNCVPSAAAACWVQLAVTGQFTASNTFFRVDPDVGVVKELDVLETSVAQTVTVNGKPVTVPALPAPPVVVVTPPTTGTVSYVLTGSPTNPIILTVNPANGSFTLTGGGVAVKQ